MKGRVLIIAGSDPSGGAGIQADIKTVSAFGGYAATAITAITVQNTTGVSAVHSVAPHTIRAQIEAVMDDIGADAIKIGMIANAESAKAIARAIRPFAHECPVILDPVLIATSGDALASDGVARVILDDLAPLAALITPNLDEARALTVAAVDDVEGMIRAGEALRAAGAGAVLVKGGHLNGGVVIDCLVTEEGAKRFENPRIETRAGHGTGCTLASAIAAGLARGDALAPAVDRAIDYVQRALKSAPGYGAGAGPLNHAVSPKA